MLLFQRAARHAHHLNKLLLFDRLFHARLQLEMLQVELVDVVRRGQSKLL